MRYAADVPDFELLRLRLQKGEAFDWKAKPVPSAVLVFSGQVAADSGESKTSFEKGGIFFVPASVPVRLSAIENAEIYWATVPD
jgi:mannose-6-phosphate isomerase class I